MGPSRRDTRAFFAERAAGWDSRFPDDAPRFMAAVAGLRLARGASALDLGCGTGRAAEPLREAVGPGGRVVALDVTPEMLAVLVEHGRRSYASPVLADGEVLPLRAESIDGVIAAGFLPHVADPVAALRELARVVRPGGRLALVHFTGPGPYDDIRDERRLSDALAPAGWRLAAYDDGDDLYLAVAERR